MSDTEYTVTIEESEMIDAICGLYIVSGFSTDSKYESIAQELEAQTGLDVTTGDE